MARGEYITIRTQAAGILSGGLGMPFFDYSPDDPGVVFDSLPAGIVDFDPAFEESWAHVDQGAFRVGRLLIEIYIPVSEEDHGKASSEEIAEKMQEAEELLHGKIYLGCTVQKSRIVNSKIEGVAVQYKETGIKARYGWILFEVEAQF